MRLRISTKLIALIAFLLFAAVGSITWMSTQLFQEDNAALLQQMNANAADGLAVQLEELLSELSIKTLLLARILSRDFNLPEEKAALVREFFEADSSLLAVYVLRIDSGHFKLEQKGISNQVAWPNDPEGFRALEILTENPSAHSLAGRAAKNESFVLNSKLAEKSVVYVGIPIVTNAAGTPMLALAILDRSKLTRIFNVVEPVESYLVDSQGEIIAESEMRKNQGPNSGHYSIVKALFNTDLSNNQARYTHPTNGEVRIATAKKIKFANLAIVVEETEKKSLDLYNRMIERSLEVALIVFFFSFLGGYLYSGTITSRIKKLSDAALRLANGDFKTRLIPQGKDEVAQLSHSFNEMAKGLLERERVKEVFNKFHSKEIAERLLSGELKLGGEKMQALVFFSDIRGFTAIAETMDPQDVVQMINEYMTRMVSVIRAHGGIVDKYIGDAIMALWGVPLQSDDDCYQAVSACLAMRVELDRLNQHRITRGQAALRIGMGLNMGEVIAGNIGSNEKMEYTVIGSAVNLASRIEAATKDYGTDFLVSQAIVERLQSRICFEPCARAQIEGISDPVALYRVLGFIRPDGTHHLIQTPYSGASSPAKHVA